jgi:hypothetical protein
MNTGIVNRVFGKLGNLPENKKAAHVAVRGKECGNTIT